MTRWTNHYAETRARWLALPLVLFLGFSLVLISYGSVDKSGAQPTVVLDPTHLGALFKPGAVGLSVETEELATQDLSAEHQPLVSLMRLLGSAVIRLGGNSVDRSWWTSDHEPPPAWATSVITPPDLAALDGLLRATHWRVILGLNLGHFDPSRAADEARAAVHIFGPRLLGFEIGNEPNDYGDPRVRLRPSAYNVGRYLEELTVYSAAIRSSVPNARLFGPDLSLKAWLLAIATEKVRLFSAITLHYYPLAYSILRGPCKATPVPTALELLSPQVREWEDRALQALVATGAVAHRETRISETNNTGSCDAAGGPETSPVFASALWSFDWILRTVSSGVAGLNFHGYFGHCFPHTFSPICSSGSASGTRGQVTARPEYYGLLAARQLAGGRFIPIRIVGSSGSELTAYATMHAKGVLTIGIADYATAGRLSLQMSAQQYRSATLERLVAPSIGAKTGITFGQGSINGKGTIRARATRIARANRAFHFTVTAGSVVIIRMCR